MAAAAAVGAWLWWPSHNPLATAALLDASRSQDTDAIRVALAGGANPNARFPARRSFLGQTVLFLRSVLPFRPQDAEFARRELKSQSHTVLTQAIQSGDVEAVGALLNAGANPNLPAGKGWTPLSYTANAAAFLPGSSLAMARLLLARGANPNLRDADNATPLLVALYSRAPAPMIRLLLQSGADTRVRMNTGATSTTFLSSAKPEVRQLFDTP